MSIMQLKRDETRGLVECQVKLAEALVENAQDRFQLINWCKAIWPDSTVYTGQTHMRIFTAANIHTCPSFYVDLSQP